MYGLHKKKNNGAPIFLRTKKSGFKRKFAVKLKQNKQINNLCQKPGLQIQASSNSEWTTVKDHGFSYLSLH